MDSETDRHSRGEYFTAEQVHTDVARGVASDSARTRVVSLQEELLVALNEVVPAEVLHRSGRELGRNWAERWDKELSEFRGEAVSLTTVARFQADLQSAFRRLGLGVLSFDFSRFAQGLVVAEIRHAPAAEATGPLLAGVIAGLLSHFAGIELDAVTADEAGELRRFVVTIPQRLQRLGSSPKHKRIHTDLVTELESIRV